jgi:hypothetical protein
MNKSLKTIVLAITSTALIAVGAVSSPANAVSPLTVTVSKTTNLAIAGETVSVSVTGIPTGQGIYVYQCASAVASPRPASTLCRSGMTESLWLTNNGGQGAGVASQQNQMQLLKEFTIGSTTFNCSVDSCGIFVRRDHMGGSSDFSLDTIVPISFMAAAPTPTVTPTPTPTPTVTAEPKLKKASTTKFRFNSGTSGLDALVKANLKKKVSDFKLATTVTLTVEAGAAKGVTSKVVNRLAKNRAVVIKSYLVKLGVSADKIVIKTKVINSGIKPVTKVVATP